MGFGTRRRCYEAELGGEAEQEGDVNVNDGYGCGSDDGVRE